ncbi:MAG TPA: xanthine dehydrogenase family protein molybdopterin-binding subunit [Candidatus Acidoferrales bacterium]|nr:xanthine dehydrogenase family protein molybdopterin-binding subunit [Candidatus Acidoferrales bacterium]
MSRVSRHVIGTSPARLDGVEKVTGRAIYVGDISLPGMLHGKVLRSPLPHARLLHVDARDAEKLPGVAAVVTRDDIRGFGLFGAAYKDQPIVAIDKVRYAGDPVAAVAAVDEATAAEALSLIRVEYEDLPAVTDIDAALAPGAPLVHETTAAGGELHGQLYQAAAEFSGTNICYRFAYERGNVDKAFKEAARIFEHTFTFPRVQHYSLEPHAVVASARRDEITVWASSQDPFTLREHLAETFHMPLNRVRIIVPAVGAGYGGKLSVKTEPLAVALSKKAERPVKLVNSAEESFKTVTRHPARFRIKTAVTGDGRLLARECEIYMDTGAYADAGPRVTQKAGYRAPGPYRIPHVRTNAYTVYTNTVPAGAFRGFGTPQVTWAYESQMDIIAQELGLDPVTFRARNLLRRGETYTAGDTPVDCDLEEGLERAAKAIHWQRKSAGSSGKGVSCCMKDGGGTYKVSSAAVKMASDGSVLLLTGTVELGQGARTALSQIVAEELAIDVDQVRVGELETDAIPYDPATNASSSTVVMGLSVQRAAQDLKRRLLSAASRALETPPERLVLKGGRVYAENGRSLPYEAVIAQQFGARAGEIVGQGSYQDRKSKRAVLGSPTTFWEISWGAAQVAIDVETGEIAVEKYVSIADVGRALHRAQCLGQDEGAAVMALGHSLYEEMIYRDGQLLNGNLLGYRLPRFSDLPGEFHSILVENENGPGPYGSKGTGEGGLLPVAPSIANAVARAAGVRLYDLPLTPEKVWRALKNRM